MQPRAVPTQGAPPTRVSVIDSLDTIKQEYELLHSELNEVCSQRDELEMKRQHSSFRHPFHPAELAFLVAAQVAELNSVRAALCELELHNTTLRARYEEEFQRLQSEVVQQIPALSGRSPMPPLHTMGPSPRIPTSTPSAYTPYPEPQSRSEPAPAERLPPLSPSLSRTDNPKPPRVSDGESDRNRERLSDPRDPKRHRPRRDHPGILTPCHYPLTSSD